MCPSSTPLPPSICLLPITPPSFTKKQAIKPQAPKKRKAKVSDGDDGSDYVPSGGDSDAAEAPPRARSRRNTGTRERVQLCLQAFVAADADAIAAAVQQHGAAATDAALALMQLSSGASQGLIMLADAATQRM